MLGLHYMASWSVKGIMVCIRDYIKWLSLFNIQFPALLQYFLKKQERKSNQYGLAGSMLFRLSSPDTTLPKIKTNPYALSQHQIVYNTLR